MKKFCRLDNSSIFALVKEIKTRNDMFTSLLLGLIINILWKNPAEVRPLCA